MAGVLRRRRRQGNDSTVVDPATTPTTAVATTTASTAATTATPTDRRPESPTTVPPPTTTQPIDEEALKAEIAERLRAGVLPPLARCSRCRACATSRRGSPRCWSQGSPAFDSFVARIEELVALGDRVVPNDPDLYSATVENVELVGRPPYRRAIVTVCEVDQPPAGHATGELPDRRGGRGRRHRRRWWSSASRSRSGSPTTAGSATRRPREGIGFERERRHVRPRDPPRRRRSR